MAIIKTNREDTIRIVVIITIIVISLAGGATAATTIWDEESGSPLPFTWTYTNFDGFNISGIGTETLSVVQTDLGAAIGKTRTIRNRDDLPGGGLIYTTTNQLIQYEVSRNKGLPVTYALSSDGFKSLDGGNYYSKVNWLGVPYVALNGKASKLVKSILEQRSNEQKVLAVGGTWDMGGEHTETKFNRCWGNPIAGMVNPLL
ncbi:S-layer protein [uncultured archaeon]|nr:S-layer protein [uncultured archaeon]